MKIWAHRGCSQRYPENTLLSFSKACAIKNLTGIELDIQMTKDKYIVVCHDERVDRTTNGYGEIRNFTLKEIRKLKIDAGGGAYERVPRIEEVLELLEARFRNGFMLNIELKNGLIPYEGMEEKIVTLIEKRGFSKNVIYSSFNALSLEKIKRIAPDVQTAILDIKISDCLYKAEGGCGAEALHPYWQGINIPREKFLGYVVRAWFTGHLYPDKSTGTILDLAALEKQGISDVFLNEPEKYL